MSEQEQPIGEVRDPAEEYKVEFSDAGSPHHDDTDVDTALDRETDDGKGGAVVPKEDFESYADPAADVVDVPSEENQG
jgi:hypothetical protein